MVASVPAEYRRRCCCCCPPLVTAAAAAVDFSCRGKGLCCPYGTTTGDERCDLVGVTRGDDVCCCDRRRRCWMDSGAVAVMENMICFLLMILKTAKVGKFRDDVGSIYVLSAVGFTSDLTSRYSTEGASEQKNNECRRFYHSLHPNTKRPWIVDSGVIIQPSSS